MKTIYLAGGCFWGVQKYFDQFKGVVKTRVGYANGTSDNPVYQDVKAGLTGHAETVKADYDEDVISLERLLGYYYDVIDPTSVNRQGEDTGISYRTGIYYTDEEDRLVIDKVTQRVAKRYERPLAVETSPLVNFSDAEEYHQKYLDKHPDGYCHIPASRFHLED